MSRPVHHADDKCYAFGPFLIDSATETLYCNGTPVVLTAKSFEVLLVLIEQRDRVVKKQELLNLIWPGVFVEENNLARHVSTLRKVLEDRPHDSEYITTISGRGYRFVANLLEVDRAAVEQILANSPARSFKPPEEPVDHNTPIERPQPDVTRSGPAERTWSFGRLWWSVTAAGLILLALATIIWRASGVTPAQESVNRRLWQLSTGGGLETWPAWAPDGQRIAYSSDRDGDFDIWVQPANDDRPVKISSSREHDSQPAWSPDGRQIAFRSERDGGGIFLVPSGGGDERRVMPFGYRPQWSPTGTELLFYDSNIASRLYLLPLGSSSARRVLEGVLSNFGAFRAAWHPDGKRISIYGDHKQDGWGFWTVSLDGTRAVKSTLNPAVGARMAEAGLTFSNFTWSPAGDALFLEGRSEQAANIWRVKVDPATLEWQDGPVRLTIGAGTHINVSVSSDGRRLAFTMRNDRRQLRALPLAASADGKQHGTPVVAAGLDALFPDFTPDGASVVYRIARRGAHELWRQSMSDGTAQRLVTAREIYAPRWSPDGKWVAYRKMGSAAKENSIALASVPGGEERQMTTPVQTFITPSDWTADGSAILGSCAHGPAGLRSLCLLPVAAAPHAETQMRILAFDPERDLNEGRFAPDQRWISFQAANELISSSIYVFDTRTGQWVIVTEGSFRDDKPRWSSDGRTLYFMSNRSGFPELWGRGFDPDKGQPIGAPFQVTHFESSRERIASPIRTMDLALTKDTVIVPIVESTGSVWVLDNVDH